MKAFAPDSKGKVAIREIVISGRTAFTLIELLVVVATLAVLAATLLPALAGTQAQSKETACAANFRQWAASANLYASDHRSWLPSFNPSGGGLYAWDVGTNMITALYPYGMNVPVWFCPMRPNEWNAVDSWAVTSLGHPIHTINDLYAYYGRTYSSEIVLHDNYWVPRSQGNTSFPTDYSKVKSIFLWPPWLRQARPDSAIYGWPQRLHDIAAAHVPFVSDTAGSGQSGGLVSPHLASPDVSNISPNTAHFVNGQLIGVNLAFVDGHVASHTPSQMKPVYASTSAGSYWFY